MLLRRYGAVEVPCDDTGDPTDVDTPADLAALEAPMEINDSFRVSTPIDDTWKVLLDIERIAPLPARRASCRRSRATSTAAS